MPSVHLLDYVAGNIRSLANAIESVGYTIEWIRSPEDVGKAEVRKFDQTLMAHSDRIAAGSPRRGSLRPLSVTTRERRLCRTCQKAHCVRQAIHGDMCWSASFV